MVGTLLLVAPSSRKTGRGLEVDSFAKRQGPLAAEVDRVGQDQTSFGPHARRGDEVLNEIVGLLGNPGVDVLPAGLGVVLEIQWLEGGGERSLDARQVWLLESVGLFAKEPGRRDL